MKNIDKSELVRAAQVAQGDVYNNEFWDGFNKALAAIQSSTGKSKSKLQVKPRNLTPTVNVRHY